MQQRAGMFADLSAAELRDVAGIGPSDFEIALIAPEPTLVDRPRLYEARRNKRRCAPCS